MAHMFESGFVVRDKAWHGLATVLKDAPTIEAGIKEAGLDWDVLTCPIQVLVPQEKGKPKGKEAQGYKATVRSSDGSILGIVSDRYAPIQNKDCFGFFQKFLDDGSCRLEAAGSLRKGKNVWVLAKVIGKENEISPGDTVEPYLLLATGHDGMMSGWVSFTGVRVVCWNTQEIAIRQAEQAEARGTGKSVRILHVGDTKKNLLAVQAEIDIAARRVGDIVQQARIMKKVQMGPREYYKFLESVYQPERDAMREELDKVRAFLKEKGHSDEAKAEAFERMQTLEEKIAKPFRRESTIQKLVALFEHGPGAELAGQTLWGAVSAVTHYEEHLRAGGNEKRLYSSWFNGSTAKTRERVYQLAADMVV